MKTFCVDSSSYIIYSKFTYTFPNILTLRLLYVPHGKNCCDKHLSHIKNSMNRGAWWATVHGVANSRTRLSTHTHFRSQYLASSWVSCLNPEVLHSRHHPPSLCSCAALGKKFPLHSRHHSTSVIPKGGFIIPTTAEETGSSDVTTPKILADLRLEPRADWPQGWCSLFYFVFIYFNWRTHVHPWLIHVNVWQKPPQYCNVISLQLK